MPNVSNLKFMILRCAALRLRWGIAQTQADIYAKRIQAYGGKIEGERLKLESYKAQIEGEQAKLWCG